MNPALIHRVRPVREADIDGLLALVETLADSLTSLPRNRQFLEARVQDSLRGFYPKVRKPGGENYLFVLEKMEPTPRVVGCCGLISCVGGFDPFYTYELVKERTRHAPLGVDRELEVLRLKANHKGPGELCSLLLHPEERGGGIGRLLSLSRFHFLGTQRQRFGEQLLAEMRGHIDEQGRSPFWEAVGRNFFARDFYEADLLSGLGEKDFIRDLMPRHPIYLDLLPEAARNSVRKVHRETAPALALLLAEGFSVGDEVDIFDGGPIVSARVDTIRTVAGLRSGPVRIADVPADAMTRLVSNGRLDLRACLTRIQITDAGEVLLPAPAAGLLELGAGEPVYFSALK